MAGAAHSPTPRVRSAWQLTRRAARYRLTAPCCRRRRRHPWQALAGARHSKGRSAAAACAQTSGAVSRRLLSPAGSGEHSTGVSGWLRYPQASRQRSTLAASPHEHACSYHPTAHLMLPLGPAGGAWRCRDGLLNFCRALAATGLAQPHFHLIVAPTFFAQLIGPAATARHTFD